MTQFIAIPTFRIHHVGTAKSFYIQQLDFSVDWEHYYSDDAPVYMQVSRNGLILHLTENERFQERVIIFVKTEGLAAFREELYARNPDTPELETTPWNTKQLEIADPFGNLLRFNE